MGLSYPRAGTNVPKAVSNDEIAEEFSDLTSDWSRDDLANATGRTPHAAKKWHAGVQAPDSASLLTAARRTERIRAYVLGKIGADGMLAPRVLSQLHDLLVDVGTGEGAEACDARRLFREIFRPSAGHDAMARGEPVHTAGVYPPPSGVNASKVQSGGVSTPPPDIVLRK
jgi:hypothetical protein